MDNNVTIVGAGLWGCTVARQLAEAGYRVSIIEKRHHIAGNCASRVNPTTGIEYHVFGTHIFHTSNRRVWNFVNQFTSFNTYKHTVWSRVGNKTYSMPVNLATINSFFNANFNPSEAKEFIKEQAKAFSQNEPTNFEEQALNLMGKELYQAFFKGYTEKQWHKKATELPATMLNRLPFRFSYDNNYFYDFYQGIPSGGYQALFNKLIDHPSISVSLNRDFLKEKNQYKEGVVFYTGAIDELFDYNLGELEYRGLRFNMEIVPKVDHQGCSVLNYGDSEVPQTRIAEYKHFHPERKEVFDQAKSLLYYEYPADYVRGSERYYPINTLANTTLHQQYMNQAVKEWPNLIVGGRLGRYQYFDMDKTVNDALQAVDQFLINKGNI